MGRSSAVRRTTLIALVEEEIFHPAARAADVESSLLDEAEVEHESAKDMTSQLRAMSGDEAWYDAKVIVPGEHVDHHVQEEHDELFPACRKAKLDLATLGAELAARKAELIAELQEETV